jgi:hypothetical protein
MRKKKNTCKWVLVEMQDTKGNKRGIMVTTQTKQNNTEALLVERMARAEDGCCGGAPPSFVPPDISLGLVGRAGSLVNFVVELSGVTPRNAASLSLTCFRCAFKAFGCGCK